MELEKNQPAENIGSGLKHELGPVQFFSMAFGAMIGVGWITVLGAWLANAGSLGAISAFFAGFCLVMLVALAYGELASMLPVAGGEVSFAQIVFGAPMAFAVAWALLLTYIGGFSFEMISVGWIASTIVPMLSSEVAYSILGSDVHIGELCLEILIMVVVVVLNARGARSSARLQDFLTYSLILISLVFIIAGFWWGSWENLQPHFVFRETGWKWGGIFVVFSTSLFFYAGFNFATQALGERSDQMSPRAFGFTITLAVAGGLLFYAAVILSASLLVPRGELLAMDLPAAGAFESAFGSMFLRDVVLLAGLLGLVTSWNALVFAAARILFVLGRMHLAPAVFGHLHLEHGTPVNAILTISGIGFVGALLGRAAVLPIVSLGGLCVAFAWLIVSAAALRLRWTQPARERRFRVLVGPLVFVLAVAGTLFAVYTAIRVDLFGSGSGLSLGPMILLLWSGAGILIWIIGRRRRKTMSEAERTHLVETVGDPVDGKENLDISIKAK
jgi:amino acid transporter